MKIGTRAVWPLLLLATASCAPVDLNDLEPGSPTPVQLADADGDGVADAIDCGADDASVFGGAPELCDGKDNDCNGLIDDPLTINAYLDADSDGFGDPENPLATCSTSSSVAQVASDCNDQDATINVDALELCDGKDNDCDGRVDADDTLALPAYIDADGDGYGTQLVSLDECTLPIGYAAIDGDCDDTNAQSYPSAFELCDDKDNDCNGEADDLDGWYADADGDGFAPNGASAVIECTEGQELARYVGDCNDSDAAVHPALVDAHPPEGETVPVRYSTLQAALDQGSDCGSVLIAPGDYSGHALISERNGLVVSSLEGRTSVVLRATGGTRALTIDRSKNIKIQALTLESETVVPDMGGLMQVFDSSQISIYQLDFYFGEVSGSDEAFGGAIGAVDVHDFEVQECSFVGNTAPLAGAIGLDSSQLTLSSSSFVDNEAQVAGGAVGVGDVQGAPGASSAVVLDSAFQYNRAAYLGGAIAVDRKNTAEVIGCWFDSNEAYATVGLGTGGGAVANPSRVERSYFLENRSNTYGGALLVSDSVEISNSLFWRNFGLYSGGAINVYDADQSTTSNMLLNYSTFVDNNATYGSSIYYYDADSLSIKNNIFSNLASRSPSVCSVELIGNLAVSYNDFYPAYSLFGCFESEEQFIGSLNNTEWDPMFLLYDALEDFAAQSFRLQEASPCQTGGEGKSQQGAFGGDSPLD